MRPLAADLIDLNDGEACDEGYKGEEVEHGVDILPGALLLRVIECDGLLDECGLGEGEDGDGHGNRVAGEEDEGGGADVCPDVAAEDEDAYLGDDAGSWW